MTKSYKPQKKKTSHKLVQKSGKLVKKRRKEAKRKKGHSIVQKSETLGRKWSKVVKKNHKVTNYWKKIKKSQQTSGKKS